MTKTDLTNEIDSLKGKFAAEVAQYVREHPLMTMRDVGKRFGLSVTEVSLHARTHGIRRLQGSANPNHPRHRKA